MVTNILKLKSFLLFTVALFAISILSNIAFASTPLPQISQTYSYDLECPEGYDGAEDIYLYTGKPLKPKVRIGYSPNELVEGRDYDLTYANNINAGTATVIATGKGNYSGQSTYRFYIEKKDIQYYYEEYGGLDIADDLYAFTGKPIKPKVASKKFRLGIDFDVTYLNNIKPGNGMVLITGKGLYDGTIKIKFKIKRLTSLKIKAVYDGTKRIVCTISNAAVGDTVKLKIGKRSYTKKVNKLNYSTLRFKIPKQKYGKKYTITVRSKNGATIKKKSTVVWYTKKLRVGQTRNQVRYNSNWGIPSYKNVYSGYSGRQETWAYEYYDSYGNWYNTAYLYFRNGKLTGWTL